MVYFQNIIFTKDECKSILDLATEWEASGLHTSVDNVIIDKVYKPNKRKSTQSLQKAERGSMVYTKVNQAIMSFGYELCVDSFGYDVIKYKVGDFIWKHTDDGADKLFSLVAQLNKSTDYEGGDFLRWDGENSFKMDRSLGYGIIFKSNVYHEVTHITEGERHSFVLFLKSSEIKSLKKQALI